MKLISYSLPLKFFFILCSVYSSSAQDGIGIGTTSPDESAVLEIESSTKTKGLLIPRTDDLVKIINPADNLIVQDEASSDIFVYNDNISEWQSVFPRGGIIMWSGAVNSIPDGWSLCNGSSGTPDLRGRFIVGYNNASVTTPANATNKQINYGNVGNTGGENTHALSTAELATHNHTMANGGNHSHTASSSSAGAHTHTHPFPSGTTGNTSSSNSDAWQSNANGTRTTQSGGSHNHPITVNTTNSNHSHTINTNGSGTAHENRPAYYVLAFIMKL